MPRLVACVLLAGRAALGCMGLENGAVFTLNDGSGPVGIDAREKVDTDLTKAFEQAQNVSYGDLTFGQYHVHVPYSGGDEHTTGIRAIEKILAADGNLFAMGKLAGGTITKQDGMLGKLLLSNKGRDKLVGSVKRNSIIGFVLGGLMFLPGGYFSVFGEAPVDNCANMTDQPKESCSGRVSTNAGQTHDWKVTKEGTYQISITATGTNASMKLWPLLTVSKGGDEIGQDGAGSNDSAKVIAKFEKGTYKILVKDVDSNHISKLKGGAGYTLVIKQLASDDKDTDKAAKKGDDDDDKKAEEPKKEEPKKEEPKAPAKKVDPKAKKK